ncbi:MAG: thioredoxin family protein [Sedimentibacter sp.]|uniref:thioredoxin family protein n=1 Tax=Sedimentibacter sp. TaxID=1960295 RepID=UPI003158BDBB
MNYVYSNEELKNVIDCSSMTMVYFGSVVCGVCSALKPKIEEMLSMYPHINAVQVDVDKSPDIAASNSIFTIPGIILFIEGREAIRQARFISVPDLDEKISRYYELFFEE